MLMGRGSHDVEDRVFSVRDFEDEGDAGGRGLDGALVAEGEGCVWLPGATDAVERSDHIGVLGLAGEPLHADQAGREANDITSGLETDQSDLLAAADTEFKVAVSEQAQP